MLTYNVEAVPVLICLIVGEEVHPVDILAQIILYVSCRCHALWLVRLLLVVIERRFCDLYAFYAGHVRPCIELRFLRLCQHVE